MNDVYIALGSNLDSPATQLTNALNAIARLPATALNAVSSFYRSKPLGPQDQPDYINAVACIGTELEPLTLLDGLQQIERDQGRRRLRRWGERTLDLDILLYGGRTIQSERLIVPHYDMCNREFVIVPLYEIAPDLVLPDGTLLQRLTENFAAHRMTILD